MLRLCVAAVAVVWLALGTATAEPKPVSLWHVFNLETDMIYGGIKSFNESPSDNRIDARLMPANQLVAELIKAIATGSNNIDRWSAFQLKGGADRQFQKGTSEISEFLA